MKHIIRAGQFREGPTGPAVQSENIVIPLSAKRIHRIEESTTVEGEQAVGLYIQDPGTVVGQGGVTQLPEANFNSAYLMLRNREKISHERIYLSTIKKWNDQAEAYPLHLADKIQFSRSELIIENTEGLTENHRCQFQVAYLTPAG